MKIQKYMNYYKQHPNHTNAALIFIDLAIDCSNIECKLFIYDYDDSWIYYHFYPIRKSIWFTVMK